MPGGKARSHPLGGRMASNEGKIAAAITGLAGVFFLALIVKPAFDEWRLRRVLAEFEQQASATMDQAAREMRRIQQQQVEAQNRRRQEAAALEAAKVLGASERCVAGSVVRVTERDGVPSYQQVLKGGKPVRCAGNRRL